MKISSLKKGLIDRYSFKDLEYGIKLIQAKIDRKMIAINEIEQYNRVYNKYKKGSPEITQFKEEIAEFEETIKLVQDDIANRLLTGNDDGVVMRELLGASHV